MAPFITCYPQHVYNSTDHLSFSLQNYRVERNLTGYSVFRNNFCRISWLNFAQASFIRILGCSDDVGTRDTWIPPWRNHRNRAVFTVYCMCLPYRWVKHDWVILILIFWCALHVNCRGRCTLCVTLPRSGWVCECGRLAVQEMSSTVHCVTLNYVGKFKGKRLSEE
jgi:hypothetical protein